MTAEDKSGERIRVGISRSFDGEEQLEDDRYGRTEVKDQRISLTNGGHPRGGICRVQDVDDDDINDRESVVWLPRDGTIPPLPSFSIHPRNPFSSPSSSSSFQWSEGTGASRKDITSFNEFHGVARTVLRGNALPPSLPPSRAPLSRELAVTRYACYSVSGVTGLLEF